MSFTSTVVTAVPLLLHSSRPAAGVVAEKYTVLVPPAVVVSKFWGVELPDPATISATRTVPAVVLSVLQSSVPSVVVVATK